MKLNKAELKRRILNIAEAGGFTIRDLYRDYIVTDDEAFEFEKQEAINELLMEKEIVEIKIKNQWYLNTFYVSKGTELYLTDVKVFVE